MSKVTRYLDCGCALLEDGSRSWCPTCANGGPKVDEWTTDKNKAAEARIEALEGCLRELVKALDLYIRTDPCDQIGAPETSEYQAACAASLAADALLAPAPAAPKILKPNYPCTCGNGDTSLVDCPYHSQPSAPSGEEEKQ